ncbi:uncharacterized protein LOC141863538 [Acropora palmata]|uniref:uncharacterized protein LOC141863538 n=1 Tax=Acropora palmata TaxID=6131 RepID=UPI003DA1386A
MKLLLCISLSFLVTLVHGKDLGKLEACNRPEKEELTCQAGLSCELTKNLVILGKVTPVKQCMPNDTKIDIETVNMDEDTHTAVTRMKRILPLTPCASEITCLPNFCCPRIVQRCLPKLPELGTCNLQILHNCGCQNGLVCRQTTSIAAPIIGFIKIPLLQCVKP